MAKSQLTTAIGDTMVEKRSPNYTKSEYEQKFYGNDNYTTFDRELKVEGNDQDSVKWTSTYVKGKVMP